MPVGGHSGGVEIEHFVVAGKMLAPGGAYSHGVVAGGLLFPAGVGPHSPTGELVGQTIGEQTVQVLRNIENILRERRRTLADVVKVTVHLADVERDFTEFDAAFRQVVPSPYPVRTTVGSTLLGILVEIDVVALA